jgi:succinoglycan biosynthesis protein ExoL
MKFFDVHYNKLISKNRVIYTPNIPDFSAFSNYKHKVDGEFTVGFIGSIRYLKQMKMLVDAAGIVGCKVLFAGAGGTSSDYEEISRYCKDKPYVSFTGRYDYQTQIASLYGAIDCVYAVYDASNSNVRIALPNRLYEAVYCGLPLIVAKGTYLSEIVDKYGVGYSVDYISTEELCKCIEKMMSVNVYSELSRNCKSASSNLLRSNWSIALTDALTK